MKKIFTISTVVAVIAAVIIISTKAVSSQKKLYLLYENVEALADGEGTNSYTCETNIKVGNSFVFYCAICDWVPNSDESFFSSTKTCIK